MQLEETIRELIKKEMKNGIRLSLRQVADKTQVDYKRLWAFLSPKSHQRLSAAEAQQVYEALSGQPLLPTGGDE